MMQRGWVVVLGVGLLATMGCPKPETQVALHADATLKALTVMADGVAVPMSPEFSSEVRAYAVVLPYRTHAVSLTLATTDDVASDVTVTDSGATTRGLGNDTSLALGLPPVGAPSTVHIVLTAQDGVTTGGYTVRITQAAPALRVSQGTTDISSDSTVSLGAAVIGAPVDTTFTIGNGGTAALVVESVVSSSAELVVGAPVERSIAPSGSTTFNLRFAPTSTGTKTARVTIVSNTGTDFTFTVSGVAMAAPSISFVKQANGTATASMSGGVLSVSSVYAASGNAFKYVAPNYYGTGSNGFIAFPRVMTGDFSITAEVTVTAQWKANTASGIGLGLTTGFSPSDAYAYILMRSSSNVANGSFVNGAGSVGAGPPSVTFTNGTPVQLSFIRAGSILTLGAGPVGGALTSSSAATSAFTNGTTVYGAGPVYPAISFNNVDATITKLVIKDGAGDTVYDSATGTLVSSVPASLTTPTRSVAMNKGASTSVAVTAVAFGGAPAAVTAVAADPTIVQVWVTNEAASSTVHLTGLQGGATTVTVTNTADTSSATSSVPLTVAVNDYDTSDGYGSLAGLAYPAPGSTGAPIDGALALTFDAPPTLNPGGSIKIYTVSDGAEVDSVGFAGETQTFGGTSLQVGTQLVRVADNTVFFTPHLGALAYGTAYYVVIPRTSITGTLKSVAFNGLSSLSTVATWRFTTRTAPTLDPTNITVDGAQTSAADFRTLQGALGAVASDFASTANVTIHVAEGTYRELLRFVGPGAARAQTIRIVGPAGNSKGDTCVFQYANGNAMNGTTQTRASFYFTGANLILENVTLRNSGVRSEVAQAETIFFGSGPGFTMAAYNSSFSSHQDTIQTSGRTWFYKCSIEGNVDFIWGTAQASLFEDCDLHVIGEGAPSSVSIVVARTGATIAAGTSGTVGKGYVLLDSRVTVDDGVTVFYGRDPGLGAFYDQVALINVAFSTAGVGGTGTLGAGLWTVSTPPLFLGDPSIIGWKAAGCTGLNLPLATAANTASTISSQSTEYDTRDHILNRVVTVTNAAPVGFEAAPAIWDVSTLAAGWGAPTSADRRALPLTLDRTAATSTAAPRESFAPR